MSVTYQTELRAILKEVFYDPKLTEQDYDELIADMFKDVGINYESMNADILSGISNGYSLEVQLDLVRLLLGLQKRCDH
jgi:hypothetical protein